RPPNQAGLAMARAVPIVPVPVDRPVEELFDDRPSHGAAWRIFRPLVRSRLRLVGLALLLLFLFVAAFAPVLAPYDPNAGVLEQRVLVPGVLGGPAAQQLGTHQIGRDILSRLLYASRVSTGGRLRAALVA